jgi:hypothetical protein
MNVSIPADDDRRRHAEYGAAELVTKPVDFDFQPLPAS